MNNISINFSVIIPLYNKERHITRTILSVKKQTFSAMEIIVIDDGSTDKSLEIVSKLAEEIPFLKVIKQKNSGVSIARNTGIINAKGNYICFLDADDEWQESHLKEVEKLINKFPGMGLYADSYQTSKDGVVSNRKELKKISNKQFIVNNYYKYTFRSAPFFTSSIVVPKYIFKDIGMFIEGAGRGEDLEMWGRISLKYKMAVSGKVGAIYYLDTDNRSHMPQIRKTIKKTKTKQWWVLEEYVKWLDFPELSKVKKRWIKERIRQSVFIAAVNRCKAEKSLLPLFKIPITTVFSISSYYYAIKFIKNRVDKIFRKHR